MRIYVLRPRPSAAIGIAILGLLALLIGRDGPSAGARPATDSPRPGTARPVQPTPIPRGPLSAVGPRGNPNVEYGFTMALREHDARLVADGFQWAEFEVDWGHSEPRRGSYDWANVDNIVNAAAAAGAGLILRVDQSPGWANGSSSPGWYPPNDPADYGRFLGALAAHVEGQLARPPVYEIWNEPNISDNWGGRCPSPAAYTALVRAAYPAVKAADPAARVLAGAVTTVGALPSRRPATCAVDDLAFLHGMYDSGIRGYYDALSSHPYGFGDMPEAEPRTPGRTLVFRRAELHREVMLAHGDAAHHLWITETGWALDPGYLGTCRTTCPTCYDWYFLWAPQEQAAYMVRAVNWARAYWDWLDAVVIFNFDYNESWLGPCDAFTFFSVLDRPAEPALRTNRLNPPPTYTPRPTSTPTPGLDGPPTIGAPQLSPASYWHTGGLLQVAIDAVDADSTAVSAAYFQVTYPDGSTQIVPMTLAHGTPASGTWQGTFTVPAPATADDETYGIKVSVVEDFPPRRVVESATVPFTVSQARFVDVPHGFWAYAPVEFLAARGIVSGYADHTFRPYNNATRGQFTKMIVAAAGWPILMPPTPTFSDLPPTNPYYGPIETAAARRIIGGYADHTFRPNNNITRGQIAKILTLAEAWPATPPPTPRFVDVPPANPFYSFVEAVATRGVAGGYTDNSFRPNNDATRAQLSKMLYNAVSIRPGGTSSPTPSGTPTITGTVTETRTPGPSLTGTVTETRTPGPSPTGMVTETRTPGPSPTPTATGTASPTPTLPPKGTTTPSGTPTVILSPSPSITATPAADPPRRSDYRPRSRRAQIAIDGGRGRLERGPQGVHVASRRADVADRHPQRIAIVQHRVRLDKTKQPPFTGRLWWI